MDGRIGNHRVHESDVVDAMSQIWKQIRNVFPALAVLLELPTRLDDTSFVFVSSTAEGFYVDRFVVHAIHLRLVVEGIDVAWPAVHVEEDHGFGFGRKVRRLGAEWILPVGDSVCLLRLSGKELLIEHPGHRESGKSTACLPEELTPCSVAEVFLHGRLARDSKLIPGL